MTTPPTWRRLAWLPVFALLLAACTQRSSPSALAAWTDETGYRWRPLVDRGQSGSGFAQLSPDRTGIAFTNFISDSAALNNQVLAQGGGVALADIDGDGRTDLFFAKTEGPSALYRNLGGWRFEEIGKQAGLAFGDRAVTGVVFADADGDGDQDLFVNALGGPNGLFLNDGVGQFREDGAFPGRASRAGSTTSTLADIDGDGDLDLYLANDKAYNAQDRFSPQERAFDQVVRQVGPKQFEVVERMRTDYRVVLREDLGGVVMLQKAEPDTLYLNDGAGLFTATPIAHSARFLDENDKPFEREPDNFTLVARFYDITGDGAPDLYVANDFEDPDQFWINDGRGNFRLAPKLAQRATSNAAMALDMGDVNRDGQVDFFSVDMLSRDRRQRKTQIPTHTALPKRPGVIDDRPQMQRNTLFLNRGDGTFAQIAELAGVDASGWSWSTLFLDVDLDGWEDLLVGTGNYWDFMDADTQERLKNRLSDLNWRQQRMTFPRLKVPNYAFRNRGDLTFEDVSDAWKFSAGPDISHGMAAGDLDNDGDLDIVVNRLESPALVLENRASANRIAVTLKGTAPNSHGINARVRVLGGAVPRQEREMTAGGLYLSSSEPIQSFATGSATTVTIEVAWRSGAISRIDNALPNRLYQIAESGGATDSPSPVPRPAAPLFSALPFPSAAGHTEPYFDDASRQLLLPNSFAELGPGASWLDLDHDGDDDLVVAAGKTGRTQAWRNDRGRLVPTDLGTPPALGDQTTVLAVPDGKGGTRLLVGQTNYEAASLEEALRLPSVLAVPLGPTGRPTGPAESAIPGDTASIGPLAAADYDGDGDLDLFVGGRIIPGGYPLSPSSRLFLNDGTGRIALDQPNSGLLKNVGMVSAALFSDLDDDGDPDLLLTTEWGPLKLFVNERGRFQQAPPETGFANRFGRWWGLATGDFDEDGRTDIIATSWGRNTRPLVDSVHPLYAYFGDFADRGGLDLILAQPDLASKSSLPLASFARLSLAIPKVAERIKTFGSYADATVDQLLGPKAAAAFRLGVNSSEHLLWLNLGGRFEPRPLPLEAQLAPAIGPVVGDFNGDGHEDLFLSQNFFPTDLDTPRYDAGRSLLLLGDGQGGLRPVAGQESGLLVYGDQRGAAAADFDQDGRLDLVVTQNGAETRLFRNAGAQAGVVVRLLGGPANPSAVGAAVRLAGAKPGPWRERQMGSGYWSVSGSSIVIAPGSRPTSLEVRWPNGRRSTATVPPGQRAVTISPP